MAHAAIHPSAKTYGKFETARFLSGHSISTERAGYIDRGLKLSRGLIYGKYNKEQCLMLNRGLPYMIKKP